MQEVFIRTLLSLLVCVYKIGMKKKNTIYIPHHTGARLCVNILINAVC